MFCWPSGKSPIFQDFHCAVSAQDTASTSYAPVVPREPPWPHTPWHLRSPKAGDFRIGVAAEQSGSRLPIGSRRKCSGWTCASPIRGCFFVMRVFYAGGFGSTITVVTGAKTRRVGVLALGLDTFFADDLAPPVGFALHEGGEGGLRLGDGFGAENRPSASSPRRCSGPWPTHRADRPRSRAACSSAGRCRSSPPSRSPARPLPAGRQAATSGRRWALVMASARSCRPSRTASVPGTFSIMTISGPRRDRPAPAHRLCRARAPHRSPPSTSTARPPGKAWRRCRPSRS